VTRKTVLNLLKIVVSLGLLIVLFRQVDLAQFWVVVRQANVWWLLAALGMMLLGVVIRAWRWQILLDAINVKVPLVELTAIYFIGFLFNNLLPSGLGGDAMRIVELNRHSEQTADAVTSVFVDRFLGLSALQAIGTIALIFNWKAVPAPVAYFTLFMFVGMLIGGILLINRPLYISLKSHITLFRRVTEIAFVGKLFSSFQQYPIEALGRSYLVSLLFNLSLIAMNMCIGLAVGVEATIIQYAIFIPITSVVLILPISFGGLGVREGTYIGLFQSVGVLEEQALAMSLLVYVVGNVFTGVIGGAVYLYRIAINKS